MKYNPALLYLINGNSSPRRHRGRREDNYAFLPRWGNCIRLPFSALSRIFLFAAFSEANKQGKTLCALCDSVVKFVFLCRNDT
jgi:hypothetical protein